IALRDDRKRIAPAGGFGDDHARQQAASRFRQGRVGPVLRLGRLSAAGGEGEGGGAAGEEGAHQFTPSRRKPEKPIQLAARASRVTATDSQRPAGIIAQASLAWTTALMKPRTHMIRRT